MKGKDKKKSRREFLNLWNSQSSTEKIKMLTPDGQLVEVDKRLIEKIKSGKKASNKEILDWTQSQTRHKS